ncbi:hypothetical protein J7337_001000 [Fusarium musae]|uniref:Prion-inhibition and propagation HeLo domain-containing protein n=1 Tax=Fusarium musae TaxID=1042133 RepID=A0A9P8DSU2_9HYPO|nr:hypothetical protein J7337_001000 [Fusarium musae]KAG9507448.1 hypothetical protein J7337_001000 [Fusarium musae]
MAEAVGTVLAVVGVLGQLFDGCVRAYSLFTAAANLGTDSQRLLCKVRIEEMRLVVWGRDWGVAEGRLEAHLGSTRNPQLRSLALQILEELHSAVAGFKKLKNRYGLVDEGRASLEVTGSKPRKSPSPSRKRSKDDESRGMNCVSRVTSERNWGKEMGLRARWVIAGESSKPSSVIPIKTELIARR